MLIRKSAALLGAGILCLAAPAANATLISIGEAACGGFSTCDDSSFISIVGGPLDEFIDFDVDKFGVPVLADPVSGDVFSDLVTFSSDVGSFGGVLSTDVDVGFAGTPSAEIGPVGGFTGVLVIDFLTPVTAFGFGTVEFGLAETISIFDTSNTLIGVFAGVSNSVFDYFGLLGTAGEQISRVELDGEFFAIQNIQFNLTAVPEPQALALVGLGLTVVSLWTRRRRTLILRS